VQWDAKFSLVKVNPLLCWTKQDVWTFINQNNVPYNPLHDQNYPSIGCWPCTQAVAKGGDERAGRWAGKGKKECGLHDTRAA
jgi:phosphoadenosine phosphosulfate reductase